MLEILRAALIGAFIGGMVGLVHGTLLSVTVHELGHLVFGKLTGYRFVSFRVSSFIWFKEDGKIRFARSKSPFAGQCLMAPPEDYSNFKFVWYNLGGGVFNLIFSFLWFIAYVIVVLAAYNEPNVLLFLFFMTGVVVNLLMAILNLLPIIWFGTPVDGRNILTALKSKDAAWGLYMMLYINSQLAMGKRYRDFPGEMFALSPDADLSNYLVAWMVMLEAERLSDLGQHQEALEQYNRLGKLPAIYGNSVKLAKMYIHTVLQPDIEKAHEIYADKKIKTIFTHLKALDYSWVIAAYEYLGLNNKEKAAKTLKRASKLVENHPNLGEKIMIKEHLERVGKLINEDPEDDDELDAISLATLLQATNNNPEDDEE